MANGRLTPAVTRQVRSDIDASTSSAAEGVSGDNSSRSSNTGLTRRSDVNISKTRLAADALEARERRKERLTALSRKYGGGSNSESDSESDADEAREAREASERRRRRLLALVRRNESRRHAQRASLKSTTTYRNVKDEHIDKRQKVCAQPGTMPKGLVPQGEAQARAAELRLAARVAGKSFRLR